MPKLYPRAKIQRADTSNPSVSMAKKNTDYYAALGLKRGATPAEIKQAYRTLAKEHHPDKNNGDAESEAKFKVVNEAYQTLSDEQKRRAYDTQTAYSDFSDRANQQQSQYNPWAEYHEAFRRVVRDSYVTIQVSMAQVYSGEEPTVNYERIVKCTKCPENGGTCDCDNGAVREFASVKLAGLRFIRTQHTYQFSNKGNYHSAAKSYGDLVVTVEVLPTHGFYPSGVDIYTNILVHFQDAIDGSKVDYLHIDGKTYRIQLPPFTERGQQIRLPGMGFIGHGDERGALYATVDITIDYSRITAKDTVNSSGYNADPTTEQDGPAAH